jgi:putative exosortase-associated protein (TIGR04073 family)
MWRKLFLKFFILFLIISGLVTIDSGLVYAGDPVQKLGRGITNVATGWVEIPKEIGRSVEKSGDFAGLVVGPFKGIAKAIGRTIVGVYEVVTFPIPLPRRYEPVIEPAYVFENQ